MKILLASLLVIAAAKSHDKITEQEFDSESKGKWVFLDMYAEW
jgi:thiol:disulfide interchange protein